MALAAVAVLVPATAHAVTVECTDENGTCTVSNDDGFDSLSCDCTDAGSGGSTGGNEWAGLDEAELAEVCEGELSLCEVFETDFMTTTAGNPTDTFADTGDSFSTCDPTDGLTSDTGDTGIGSTTDHGTTGDGTTGDGTTGDGTTGDGTTGGATMSTTGETNPIEDGSSEDSSGGGAGNDDEAGGCGCTTEGSGHPAAALGLLALLGLRRRRR